MNEREKKNRNIFSMSLDFFYFSDLTFGYCQKSFKSWYAIQETPLKRSPPHQNKNKFIPVMTIKEIIYFISSTGVNLLYIYIYIYVCVCVHIHTYPTE